MSFMLTTKQVREGSKTVTRRLGWKFLKRGDRLMACVKCQGLGKGGKIEKIREIEVVDVRRERLDLMLAATNEDEAHREGFPYVTNRQFVQMFCTHMGCTPATAVTRIEFKYCEVSK